MINLFKKLFNFKIKYYGRFYMLLWLISCLGIGIIVIKIADL